MLDGVRDPDGAQRLVPGSDREGQGDVCVVLGIPVPQQPHAIDKLRFDHRRTVLPELTSAGGGEFLIWLWDLPQAGEGV
ncbi:hypothetical protein GCM10009554_27950 [Kribbella koreensis]|uniref:Uncharacterized protein n=2 Tax=Kribbella TaxID=182639 RepID=A0ABP6WAA6_9ACTN